MRARHPDTKNIRAALGPHGLFLRGFVNFAGDEAAPRLADGRPAGSVLLVGNVGSSLWPAFSRWRETQPDRGGSSIATRINLTTVAVSPVSVDML